MADSNFRGPVNSMGQLEDTSSSPLDGPSIGYQGDAIPDPRYSPWNKDGTIPGRVPSFFCSNLYVVTDQIPMILASTVLATTAQSAVTAQAVTLNATALGGSAAGVPSAAPGTPIVPLGTTVATTVFALDFGFTTGTTAAASSTVVVVDSSMFRVGHWICIGGAGNTSNTSAILTMVTGISNATTITISPVAVGALSHAPIGNANLQTNLLPPAANFGPSAATASGANPYLRGGLGSFFNPVEAVTRNVTVTGNTTNATAVWNVTGYDIYGALMFEQVSASGTTTIGSKKAFKYIQSIICNATSVTGTYTFGVGDIFGINLRADRFETLTVSWNGKPLSANAGFTAAYSSTIANNTSADVRGTLSVAAFTAFNAAASNGTGRLFVGVDLPMLNVLNATAGTTAATSMFGVAQPTS